jgi:aconitate hydratase
MAIGVGGADAVDAMADIPWELKFPQVLGVHLKGELNGWTSPKDVILHLAGQLTVRGGTGYVIEYFGPGVKSLSCTGMATMCNMGAEVGATTSLFPFNESMEKYLLATRRGDLANICRGIQGKYLSADPAVHQNPGDYYDKIIEIDLSKLEPHINGPFSPDLSYPLSKFKDIVQQNGWKDEVKAGLIGSCTNSSYQDMSRAASVAQQAINQGLEIPKDTQFLITPGSEQIRATVERDGQIETLSKLGGQVLANACGPCIGQWKRTDLEDPKSPNAIVTSFNRNFRGRNDGSPNTLNFLASPEIVTAMTIAGKLSFNPLTDYIQTSEGNKVKLQPPSGDDLPSSGFELGNTSFRPEQGLLPQQDAAINVNPESDRLQLLEPFAKWNGEELGNLKVLLKAEGKCTTDHISAAGPWLKYKGHLENISNNTLIGAKSANTQKVNEINNFFTNSMDTIPNVAKDYLKRGQSWMVVTDHNYGEGSAREHAAMQPRYLGCQVILARSFARIHQTNLKKQGVLPLTFVNEKDYELINEGDVVFTKGVTSLAPGSKISVIVHKQGNPNDVIEIDVEHSMSKDQIDWFKAGSALNFIAEQNRS